MDNWKKNLLTPNRKERLFKVGPHCMILGDLVRLGFQPEQFEEVRDPWAVKSNYDLALIASSMMILMKKSENKILEQK